MAQHHRANLASIFGGGNRDGSTRKSTRSERIDPPRDLIDRMHASARQGSGLAHMRLVFPEVDPVQLEYWYRRNGYMRK